MFGIDFKTVATAAVTAVVVVLLAGLVGGNQSGVGGTRFTNGLSADSTAPSAGEVRGTNFTVTNDMKIGSANTNGSVIYMGAGDGCLALYSTASGTLTSSATTSSFCN